MLSSRMEMNRSEPRPVSLGEAVVTYGIFILGLVLLFKLAADVHWFPVIIAWGAYFAFGFYLNRVVLRGLIEWHPLYNYVENVAKAKLAYFFLWPLTYPVLFFQLAVDKVL
jgi:hypothetical protein